MYAPTTTTAFASAGVTRIAHSLRQSYAPPQPATRIPAGWGGEGPGENAMEHAHQREQRSLLLTIDTEGDDLWSHPPQITTRNTAYLPRFQEICDRFALKPVYLTNWEMVESFSFREFAHDALGRGAAEIGMHLHAWNSPPLKPLTADD